MKKWTLVCAALIVADVATAQEPAPIPASVTTSAQPVTVTSRGLFRRRNTQVMMMPVIQTSATVTQSTAPPTQVSGTVVRSEPVMMTTRSGRRRVQTVMMMPVVPVSQERLTTAPTLVRPQVTETPSTVQQAQHTVPAVTTPVPMNSTVASSNMQVVEPRQGLLARMRARRGR